jgi:hypothetical protein
VLPTALAVVSVDAPLLPPAVEAVDGFARCRLIMRIKASVSFVLLGCRPRFRLGCPFCHLVALPVAGSKSFFVACFSPVLRRLSIEDSKSPLAAEPVMTLTYRRVLSIPARGNPEVDGPDLYRGIRILSCPPFLLVAVGCGHSQPAERAFAKAAKKRARRSSPGDTMNPPPNHTAQAAKAQVEHHGSSAATAQTFA